MKVYGLIGKKLGHSFSKQYFEKKFQDLQLAGHTYKLFELETINKVKELLEQEDLSGFNVTVPYKEAIIPFLTKLDTSAQKVGAVNVVKIIAEGIIGYNSDYYGFKSSLIDWLTANDKYKALVLGSGGASKAVTAALHDLKIPFGIVSRNETKGDLTYEQLQSNPEFIKTHNLIINTTPVGMFPQVEKAPLLPYHLIDQTHFLYDLVYNPELTYFLKLGEQQGATIKNGLEMLHLQAEKSWDIWTATPDE